MAAHQVGLADVSQGTRPSSLRLLAPLRYIKIQHPEKFRYDILFPLLVAVSSWGLFISLDPKPAIFGDEGLLRFTRDVLAIVLPFLIGALATVAVAGNAPNFDKRPAGAELFLDGESLTLRRFVCYLLGYLSFLTFITLISAIGAALLQHTVISWTSTNLLARELILLGGLFVLSLLLSTLAVTVLWALYFLTDIVNRPGRNSSN